MVRTVKISSLNFLFVYLSILAVLGLRCCPRFSLVVSSRGYSLVTSLASERRLFLGTLVSVVALAGLAHRLNRCGPRV